MILAVVGDVEEGKEGAAIRAIETFIEGQKAANTVILSAGSTRLLHYADRHAMDKGYASVILGNALKLAILNADKVLLMETPRNDVSEGVALCKEYNKSYMFIK